MSFFCSYCDESDPAYCYCTPLSRALDDAFNNLYSKGYKMRVLENNNLNEMAQFIFESNKKQGWWPDDVNERNKGEILALVHSEISEALEGLRKNLNDDHLPTRPMIEVELADAVIRILDMCGAYGYDIGGALAEKFKYNQTRADHKKENRDKEGGKAF